MRLFSMFAVALSVTFLESALPVCALLWRLRQQLRSLRLRRVLSAPPQLRLLRDHAFLSVVVGSCARLPCALPKSSKGLSSTL